MILLRQESKNRGRFVFLGFSIFVVSRKPPAVQSGKSAQTMTAPKRLLDLSFNARQALVKKVPILMPTKIFQSESTWPCGKPL
jgi:hypothetical protein